MPPKLDTTQIAQAGAASSLAPKIGEDDNNGNVSNTITSSSFHSWSVNVDDGIICEIFSRLPVKSLMRFKCLSKHWCSVIQKDQHFIDLHFLQSKARTNLLLTVPRERNGYIQSWSVDDNLYPFRYFLAIADLFSEGGEVPSVVHTTTREIDTGSYSITKPVNGLICLFDSEENLGVRVCNLSTRQVTTWIRSTFLSNFDLKDKGAHYLMSSRCNLGFDPATKEHKVICMWTVRGGPVCEVLTLGDRTWRIIDDVLPAYNYTNSYTYGDSIYVNGFIYYEPQMIKFSFEDDKPIVIVAFDVGKEKFRAIEIPDFILDQISDSNRLSTVQLLEIDRHPALSSGTSRDIFKIWLFDDEYSNGCRTNTWTAVTVELPVNLVYPDGNKVQSDRFSVRFHSVTGTGFIILYLYCWYRMWLGFEFAPQVSTYSYNLRTKIFTEIKIKGLPSGPHLKFVPCISTFTESLLPVQ
ncbi:putative F-box protein At1g32420 [Papaver somniferum]|uniref:putative F-box protein At1g32420 n=1 Tax=Papaver somniferum TaxID=3469 RepID=UPI000E6FDBA9|nr:putative F-box protein At1g32420 [Papaver somniferum]